MLGSLHLDTEEEPRRGASRANSVRFDESALHGHFSHNSRSSSEFFHVRTGSASGSHPMTERSSSHKSDGRQSSTGQSTQSTRLNSPGQYVRPSNSIMSIPAEPPPGLSLLGPLPCIIRCWLETRFSNDSLLYAAICSGSYSSVLSLRLVQQLGLIDRISVLDGSPSIKLQVYLPEATIQQLHSPLASSVPQLPTLTVPFKVLEMSNESESIDIIIGSDLLRCKNADISFSHNRITLLDDTRNTLAIPLVRPEHDSCYRSLLTNNNVTDNSSRRSNSLKRSSNEGVSQGSITNPTANDHSDADVRPSKSTRQCSSTSDTLGDLQIPSGPQIQTQDDQLNLIRHTTQAVTSHWAESSVSVMNSPLNGSSSKNPHKVDRISQATSWRRQGSGRRSDSTFSSVASSSSNQRAVKGKQMKVLKPSRSNAAATASAVQAPPCTGVSQSRWSDAFTPNDGTPPEISSDMIAPKASRNFSSDDHTGFTLDSEKSPSLENPVGGGSAFGWLNPTNSR